MELTCAKFLVVLSVVSLPYGRSQGLTSSQARYNTTIPSVAPNSAPINGTKSNNVSTTAKAVNSDVSNTSGTSNRARIPSTTSHPLPIASNTEKNLVTAQQINNSTVALPVKNKTKTVASTGKTTVPPIVNSTEATATQTRAPSTSKKPYTTMTRTTTEAPKTVPITVKETTEKPTTAELATT
jgi:hypothetical protein